ncbi:hypothetical protein PR202_gb02538 [Eleusine coracana subsp. coracana]|uniref:Glycerophosphodiester phosphodiesterase n=1 Tax=Eleusine coracana subsp. coracana TaxID=191504 RepID=A0AAV5DZC2_ELECO|nr:hypothetical protein PR202_gb02538 [Eleusine coracana subsp. coracana]
MVVGGHRGMGMNAVGAPPGARVGAASERENTLLSFGRAAAHAAVAFVEFDVQEAVYERRVTDLALEEFLSYGLQKDSCKVPSPSLCEDFFLRKVRGLFRNPSAVFKAQESNLAFLTYGQLNNVWEVVYIQYLMGVNGVIVDMVEEISKAVADFSRQPLSQSSLGSGVRSMDGSKHQVFSQQQLGFLLRLIPELIEQPH